MKCISILHVITGLNTGGAEKMLYRLLSATDRTLFAPVVISLGDFGSQGALISSLGIPVTAMNMTSGIPSVSALWRFAREVRRIRPDIIQGWMYHGNLAATLGSYVCAGHPVSVWNVRQSLYEVDKEKRLTRWVIGLSAKLSSQPVTILYNSVASAGQHQEFGFRKEKTRIIPNGFDVSESVPDGAARARIRGEIGVSDRVVLIGLIGRYHPLKDHVNFLQAAHLLAEHCADVHFLLAGSGLNWENEVLVKQIQSFGLLDRVHLLDERSDVAALNAALDIAASSSLGEAFPNVVGEAMSCAVPCVVTDVGDSAMIVGESGRIVPPSNHVALAQGLMELIDLGEDGRKRLGEMARHRIENNFSLDAVVSQYQSVYRGLVS